MNNRTILGNATMAHVNFMDINIDTKQLVKDIFIKINEAKEDILKANMIDIRNNNGFEIDFNIIGMIEAELLKIEDLYNRIICLEDNSIDKLTLTLKEGSLSDSGAVFVLENKSDKVYTYGAEYDIEVKTDSGWEKIEDSRNKKWTQVLYVSEPNKTNNIAVDFSELKTKLVSGKHYRVVKRLIEEVGGNKEYYLNAEFQMR